MNTKKISLRVIKQQAAQRKLESTHMHTAIRLKLSSPQYTDTLPEERHVQLLARCLQIT